MGQTVLVVDDQAGARRVLATELEDAGFAVTVASNGLEAWERFCEEAPDLVITDMVMPRSDGIDLLGRIRSRSEVPVILFTAHGSIETAVTALKAGADDFVSSSNFDVDGLVGLVRATLAARREAIEPAELSTRLVGSSAALVKVRSRIAGLAPLRAPVLIRGETGAGCDTVARALHDLGSTAGQPFHRIEAESFAVGGRIPERGAVYLDHAHRLGPEAQAAWAERVREAASQRFRSGGRILASAVDSLRARAEKGDFDPGLADLLSRFEIELPPLRERIEDVPPLAQALVTRASAALGRGRIRLSAPAIALLQAQRWPGNVRQLEQVIERSIAFCRGREISRRVVREVLAELEENLASIRARGEVREREELLRTIRETGGNVTRTAAILGKSRSAIYRLIAKHGVRLTGSS
jgi:DNA-binding NtrC family response regulator